MSEEDSEKANETADSASALSSNEAPSSPSWKKYPQSLPSFDPILYDAGRIRRDIDEHAQSLFSNVVNLKITDIEKSGEIYTSKTSPFDQSNAEAHITASQPWLRIISVMRKNSLAPLNISKDLLLKILTHHEVQPCFLNMFFDLRKGERLSEKGHAFWAPFGVADGSYEICYQMKYVEKNDHKQGVSWSERQVGVYHKFGPNDRAVMILLHANENTELQRRVESTFPDGETDDDTKLKRPLMLHVLVISTYLDNWRWALQDYGQLCMKKEDQFLTTPLRHPAISFRELQELRNTESKLVAAASVLQATLVVITGLQACEQALTNRPSNTAKDNDLVLLESSDARALRALHLKCEGYLRSVAAIQNRINMLIGLLADGLNQQSQQTATDISQSAYILTKKSVSDNSIVKVVTVITLTYLPVQGVATFFGMNLSGLPQTTNRIRFADNWWLFLAAALPLTGLTLGLLGIAMWNENRVKRSGNSRQAVT